MAKTRLTRRKLLAAAAPLAASLGALALDAQAQSAVTTILHDPGRMPANHIRRNGPFGDGWPAAAVGGQNDLDSFSTRPDAPLRARRVREYTLTATDRELEVAPGVSSQGGVQQHCSGPVIRATEGTSARAFVSAGTHPHDPLPRNPSDEDGRSSKSFRPAASSRTGRGAPGRRPPHHCH
jgi:hypothetical protein